MLSHLQIRDFALIDSVELELRPGLTVLTGELLIDIHGQHEFQSLTRSAAQRVLLDEYGSLTELTSQVGIAHRAWLGLLNRTLELESKARDRDTRVELLRYQAQELEALKLRPGEIEALGEERARLANRGRLAAGAHTALAELYENEGASAHAADRKSTRLNSSH